MNYRPLPALILTALSALQAKATDVWPLPSSPFPSVPAGVNSAIYPLPRLDWVARVKADNDNAAPLADKIQVIFDGDSITDGWQGNGHDVWQEHYAKIGAYDFGISGDRTEHLLWRLTQGQTKGIHPKLILLMIVTNNLGSNTNAEIAEGIKAIINEYRKLCPSAVILLQGIFPRSQSATDPLRARIKEINKIISTYADGKNVLFLDFGDKFLQPDGTLSPEIMPDFLHPNARGYQIWADAIQPVISRFFPAAK